MAWEVALGDEFDAEFDALSPAVQDELLASARLLAAIGPQLGRPHADTLKNSSFDNVKELRFRADGGVWRVAYAFDPERRAILLIAGDKAGTAEKRFYRALIAKADRRYRRHLERLATSRRGT